MVGVCAFGGALLGSAGVVLYQSLVRPVVLALFDSERFEEEYGSLEERGRHLPVGLTDPHPEESSDDPAPTS